MYQTKCVLHAEIELSKEQLSRAWEDPIYNKTGNISFYFMTILESTLTCDYVFYIYINLDYF